MFTPQKITSEPNMQSFSSGSFQNTLRKYQTSSKDSIVSRTFQKQSGHHLQQIVSQQERLKRYIRVREEQMARSRSKIKKLKQNKREMQRSRMKPILQFQTPSAELASIINLQINERNNNWKQEELFKIQILDGPNQGNQQDFLIQQKLKDISQTVQIQYMEIEHFSSQPLEQNNTQTHTHIQSQEAKNNLNYTLACDLNAQTPFEPSSHSSNIVKMIEQFPNYENYCQHYPLEQYCSKQELLIQQFQFNHSTPLQNKSQQFESQIEVHCLTEPSGGCILIKNKQVEYRISLRQLCKVWKQINNLDSLVHYICSNRPHLVPLKQCISELLRSYLL